MGIFDRIGNLGKGVLGMWKRSDDGPRHREQDVLEGELDAVRRKARVDAQLRQIRSERGEDEIETEVTDPAAVQEPGASKDSGDDTPIKKTL